MEYELLGWPPDGPKLRLDYRRFSYAGKFVMTNTGKAVARDPAGGNAGETDGEDAGAEAVIDDDRRGTEAVDGEFVADDDIVGAVAFNEDRTDEGTLWLRYVTVVTDRRGEGIGPELCRLVRDRALERGYDRLKIAVNNPFAYEALYRTGFAYTGETTGIAELVLEYPRPDDLADDATRRERYQEGLEEFRERDLSEAEEDFLESRRGSDPPTAD